MNNRFLMLALLVFNMRLTLAEEQMIDDFSKEDKQSFRLQEKLESLRATVRKN